MLRYFLLFGIISIIACPLGGSVSFAAIISTVSPAIANSCDAECTLYGTGVTHGTKRLVSDREPRLGLRHVPYNEDDASLCLACPASGQPQLCFRDVQGRSSLSDVRPMYNVLRPRRTRSVAWVEKDLPFDAPAGQGSSSGPVARGAAGPVAGPVKQHGPTSGVGPQAPEDLSPPTEAPKRLPFQGSGAAAAPSESTAAPSRPSESTGVDGARKHLVEPPKGSASGTRSTKKKSSARQLRRTEENAEGVAHTTTPQPRRRASSKRPVNEASSIPAPPVGSSSEPGLPPLPPAIPYTPPSSASRTTPAGQPTVAPGADGTVMARIPGLPPTSGADGTVPSQPTAAPQSQAAPQPLHPSPANPISGFIMDAFGEPATPVSAQPPPLQVQPRERRPPQQGQQRQQVQQGQQGESPGVLGQLGSDVQQLGSGIKGVFDRLLPGK